MGNARCAFAPRRGRPREERGAAAADVARGDVVSGGVSVYGKSSGNAIAAHHERGLASRGAVERRVVIFEPSRWSWLRSARSCP